MELTESENIMLQSFFNNINNNLRLKEVLIKCRLYSNNINYYKNIDIVNSVNNIMGGIISYELFLKENDIKRGNDLDFINIENEIYFNITMFIFNNSLHNKACSLLYHSKDFSFKGSKFYPLWCINALNNIEDSIYKNKKKLNQKTYLIHDKTSGLYKIGKSVNPNLRERTLSANAPNIGLLFYCDENIESELHLMYKNKRHRGEWFNLNTNDILDIYEIFKNKKGFKQIK